MDIINSVEKFEKGVYAVLMIMLMAVLVVTLVDLVLLLGNSIGTFVEGSFLTPVELTNVFAAVLLVLIGVELLDTIKAYFRENTIHVEIVILLAIIAVARKVLLIDPVAAKMNGLEYGFELMGIGVIVVGLAAAYYLIKKAGVTFGPGKGAKEEKE